MGVGPVGFSVGQQNLLWVMWRRGDSIREKSELGAGSAWLSDLMNLRYVAEPRPGLSWARNVIDAPLWS